MKIHNREFHQYSICGCQVKIFKVLHTYAASMKWPFMDFFGPLLPQIWPDFAEIFTRDSVLGDKNSVSIILQTLEFLQVCTFGPTLTLPLPLDYGQNRKK